MQKPILIRKKGNTSVFIMLNGNKGYEHFLKIWLIENCSSFHFCTKMNKIF